MHLTVRSNHASKTLNVVHVDVNNAKKKGEDKTSYVDRGVKLCSFTRHKYDEISGFPEKTDVAWQTVHSTAANLRNNSEDTFILKFLYADAMSLRNTAASNQGKMSIKIIW